MTSAVVVLGRMAAVVDGDRGVVDRGDGDVTVAVAVPPCRR